jgi:site-specific recombinase XerD
MVTHSRDKKLTQKNTEHFYNNASRDERLWGENGLHLKKKAKGCAFVVRFRSPTGKRKDITLGKYGVMSLEQAKNKALLIASEGIDKKDPLEERRKRRVELARIESSTVESFFHGYYTDYQESKKDGQGSLLRIKKHFYYWFNKPMSEITPSDVDVWFRRAKKQGTRFSTIKRNYVAFKALLNLAVKENIIKANPIIDKHLNKPFEENNDEIKEKRRFLQQEEILGLLKGVELRNSELMKDAEVIHWMKPFFMVLLTTGFRSGDVYGLKWNEVDLQFSHSITKVIEKTSEKHTEARSFPISNELENVLTQWKKQSKGKGRGLVFPSPSKLNEGGRMSTEAFALHWKRIKELGGVDSKLHIYALRHNFASWLVMNGVDLFTVSKLMAHSKISTTIDNYAHLAPNKASECTQALVSGFMGKQQETGDEAYLNAL